MIYIFIFRVIDIMWPIIELHLSILFIFIEIHLFIIIILSYYNKVLEHMRSS